MAGADDTSLTPSSKAPFVDKILEVPLGLHTFTALVGPDAIAFLLHDTVLTSRSPFFRKALQGPWTEAKTRTVELPDDEPEVFALYAQAVYTNALPVFDSAARDANTQTRAEGDSKSCVTSVLCQQEYEKLCKLYVFAEKIQDRKAKNTTAGALLAKITEECKWIENKERETGDYTACLPGTEAVKIIYGGTAGLCPGRAVIVEAYVQFGSRHSIGALARDTVPKEFAFDVADFALSYRRMSPYSGFEGFGRYEEHEGCRWEIEWFDQVFWSEVCIRQNEW